MALALQAVYTVLVNAQSCIEKGYQGGKGGKDAKQGRKNSWQKGSDKKGSKGQDEGGKGENRTCWTCGKNRGHCSVVSNGRQQQLVRH